MQNRKKGAFAKLASVAMAGLVLMTGSIVAGAAPASATDLSAGVTNLKVEKMDNPEAALKQYNTVKFSGIWHTGPTGQKLATRSA